MAKNSETAPQEQAMSQVLNDIRDVIVNDGPVSAASPTADPAAEVLELTEMFDEDEGGAGQAQDVIASIDSAITGNEGVTVTEPIEEVKAAPAEQPIQAPVPSQAPSPEPAATVAPAAAQPRAAMISAEAASSASAALRSLVNIASEQVGGAQFRSGNTLEDLVVEALKPELTSWLDRHLPAIVQDIVEREIQRLIPMAKKP